MDKKLEIKIDEEFKALIPALKPEEKEQLEYNLRQDGCREPLVVWGKENILVDGHNRYDICTRNHIPVNAVYREFIDREDARAWIINNQLGRRNLGNFARAALALQLEPSLRAQANANRGRRTDLDLNSAAGFKPINTLGEMAKKADLSADTIAKVKRIKAVGLPELNELTHEGEISINEADIVAKMPEAKRSSLVSQGTDAIKKGVVQWKHDIKKAEQDSSWEQAKNAEAEEEPDADTELQTLHEQYQQEFGTATGQTWEIKSDHATHRLRIGDATNEEDVDILMGDVMADIVVVDPPYNVGYKGKTKDALNYGKDKMSSNAFEESIRRASANLLKHTKPGAPMFMWHADGGCVEFRQGVKNAGWNISPVNVIWVKQKPSQSWYGYNAQHEPCLVAWKPGANRNWLGGADKNSAWFVNKPHANREHPTSKPRELYEMALSHASRRGAVLLDTFCGSGTAIEAAHRTGRICYAMEKDPGFAAVILKRMARLGLKIRLISGSDL